MDSDDPLDDLFELLRTELKRDESAVKKAEFWMCALKKAPHAGMAPTMMAIYFSTPLPLVNLALPVHGPTSHLLANEHLRAEPHVIRRLEQLDPVHLRQHCADNGTAWVSEMLADQLRACDYAYKAAMVKMKSRPSRSRRLSFNATTTGIGSTKI